jgi:hypothetical protein
MGRFFYGDRPPMTFDDRTLIHVQVIVGSKLRRGESFNFSWVKSADQGSGRITVWLHPAIPLMYEFDGNRTPTMNREWLETLMMSANSVSGLLMTPEPALDRQSSASVAGVSLRGRRSV